MSHASAKLCTLVTHIEMLKSLPAQMQIGPLILSRMMIGVSQRIHAHLCRGCHCKDPIGICQTLGCNRLHRKPRVTVVCLHLLWTAA